MKVLARSCWIIVILLLIKSGNLSAQQQLPSTGRNAADLSLAGAAESVGDAVKSLDFYQKVYDRAIHGVDTARAKSPQQFEFMRQASEAGYYLAWGRFDQHDNAAGDAIITRLSALLAPYEQRVVAPQWQMPLARLHWIKSRLASDTSDSLAGNRETARVLELTANRKALPDEYGPLSKMRISALWSDGEGKHLDAARVQACAIARELEKLAPGRMIVKLTDCANELARQDIAAKRYDAARVKLASAEDNLKLAEKKGSATPALQMLVVATRNYLATIAFNNNDLAGQEENHLAAARLMISALKRTAYFPDTTNEISTLYSNFRYDDFSHIPEYASTTKSQQIKAEVFGDLADAMEASRKIFLKSQNFGIAAASANANAANAYLKLNKPATALSFAQRAVTVVTDAGIGQPRGEFSEDGAARCQAYAAQTGVYIALKRTDDAIASNQALRHECSSWLKKFPYDFYARDHMILQSAKLGAYLIESGHGREAVSMLEFASNWGSKDASSGLAKFYAVETNDPPAAKKAEELQKLAAGQNTKRFTVPTDFGGTKFPFDVYVQQFGPGTRCPSDRALKPEEENCVGFVGIDDQVRWVKDARGGIVPPDVVIAFQKLYKIARENDVSLPDLAAYSLGAVGADVAATDADAKVISDEIKKTSFKRNPRRWLDSAGIALAGYDVTTFAQGTKPQAGHADIFALWDGAVWLFNSAANRDAFLHEPQKYAPQYGGYAAMEISNSEISGGDATTFKFVDKKLYLFDSTSEAAEWIERSAELIAKADKRWQDIYPDKIAPDTKLGGLISKDGSVEVQSKFELYTQACHRDEAGACGKEFQALVTFCHEHILKACDVAIEAAENLHDNTLLIEILGDRSWQRVLANMPDLAIADADRALALDPTQAWIAGNRADALLIKGRVGQATSIYKAYRARVGPNGDGALCKYIRQDVDELKAKKLIPDAVAAKVLTEITCE